MHALMSFTIAQPTREIGIRSALGAQTPELLLGIFGRAMQQLSIGLIVGSLISTSALSAAGIGLGPGAALLTTVAAVITIVASRSTNCDRRPLCDRSLRADRCNWP